MAGIEQHASGTPFWRRFLMVRQLGWVLEAIDASEAAPTPSVQTQPLETV